ncbi:MAG: aminoglycoside phosphotransferase family protein [Candidatus Heimdallarchaeota archaeon]|nr:aminoglycoside phosphotransferase family protein [Candidatus Heimdallarchaeota archaeon]
MFSKAKYYVDNYEDVQAHLHTLYPKSEIVRFTQGLSKVKFHDKTRNVLYRLFTSEEIFNKEVSILSTVVIPLISIPELVETFQISDFFILGRKWIQMDHHTSLEYGIDCWSKFQAVETSLKLPTHQSLVMQTIKVYRNGFMKNDRLDSLLEEFSWPESPNRLIHGDFHLGNILISDDYYIIDWEFACMGDPLYDLAYLIVYFLSETNNLTQQSFDTLCRPYLDKLSINHDLFNTWFNLSCIMNALWFTTQIQDNNSVNNFLELVESVQY